MWYEVKLMARIGPFTLPGKVRAIGAWVKGWPTKFPMANFSRQFTSPLTRRARFNFAVKKVDEP